MPTSVAARLQGSAPTHAPTCGPSPHHHKVHRVAPVLLAGARQRGQLKLGLNALAQAHGIRDLLRRVN